MFQLRVIIVLFVCFSFSESCTQHTPVKGNKVEYFGKNSHLNSASNTSINTISKVIEPEEIVIEESTLKVVRQNSKPLKVKAKRNHHKINENVKISLPPLSDLFKSEEVNMIQKDTIITTEFITVEQGQMVKAKPPFYRDNTAFDIKCLGLVEGLNSGYIMSIIEDSRNHIWLSYFNGGIGKYDGSSFTNFTKESGLPNNNVWSSMEDSKGNIWFGLMDRGGLIKYDGQNFIHYATSGEFFGNIIWGIIEDKNNHLWLGTDRGIVRFDGETFTSFINKDLFPRAGVFSVLEDHNNNIWFGTRAGVMIYNGKSFSSYGKNQGFPESRVFSLYQDPKGDIWMGTDRGAYRYAENTIDIFTTKDGLKNNSVSSINSDIQGNIWIGTRGGGLSKFDGESFQNITKEDGLPGNLVRTICFDSSNNLWASIHGFGLVKYKPDSFKHHIFKEPIFEQHIATIHEDKYGFIWFGMPYEGGLSKYDGENFEHYQTNEDERPISINRISSDKEGNLWLATMNSGLIKYDREKFIYYDEKSGLKNNKVLATYVDSKGIIWLSYANGFVSKLEGSKLTSFSLVKESARSYIREIAEDKSGHIWFATENDGACKFDGETFTFYQEKHGLANNFVLDVNEDSNKNIWIGTHDGLSKFNKDRFTNFSKKNGLPDNFVGKIKEDNLGNIWFGTDRGLGCMITNKETLSVLKNKGRTDNESFISYKIEDGLKEIEGSAMLIDSNNRLWYSSPTNISSINLNKIHQGLNTPALQLNTIKINDKFIDYNALVSNASYSQSSAFLAKLKTYVSDFKPFSNYPQTLRLPYEYNHLTFEFSAIDWTAPHDIKYTYMVDGLDREWSVPKEESKADYRNIPPGSYTFKVKSKGKYGQWSTIKSYQFSISPPWWLSTYAFIMYFILGFSTIWLNVKLYTHRMRKRQMVLEQIVANRTQTISQQKEELSIAYANLEKERNKFELKALINQINPHFIFNALNSIQQFIIGNNVKTSLDYFNKFGKLIRFSLEHSEKKFVTIDEEINVLQNYVAIENLRFEDPVELQFNLNNTNINETKIPPMFIQPFVENSIIHGLSNTKNDKLIEISFQEYENYIECSIEDNGIGRLNTKSMKNKNSGLVITQNRLNSVWEDDLKIAKIEFFDLKHPDKTTKGTRVTIKLPKDF